MFLSESMVRAIHADRMREIERSTRERRLMEAAEPVSQLRPESSLRRTPSAAASRRTGTAI